MSKRATIEAWLRLLPQADSQTWPLWPAFLAERYKQAPFDWDMPELCAQAVSGQPGPEHAWVPAALLQMSIILVDDVLDLEAGGFTERFGAGQVANAAFAVQALGFQIVNQLDVTPAVRAAIWQRLSDMAIQTAYGQQLDVQNLAGEENYWRIVRAKSAHFYRALFEIGAILGQAQAETIRRLGDAGGQLGEVIQIMDDLDDALKQPANADWHEGRNNLLVMYGLAADYPEKAEFIRLRPQAASNPEALEAAQRILMRCGAVSYALYQAIARLQSITRLVQSLDLAQPQVLLDLCLRYAEPVVWMLEKSGRTFSPHTLLGLPESS